MYLMGWRDYDPKTGRFIVPDEYEGEEDEPTSLNRYLYADGDPVNNIDPDGHLPKWLQRGWKATKKWAKKGYDFAIGDDIRTLKSSKSKWYHKAGAAASLASNFIPGAGAVKWGVKAVKYGKKMKKSRKFAAASIKKMRKAKLKTKAKVSRSYHKTKKAAHRVKNRTVKSKGVAKLNKPVAGDNIGINLRSKGTGKSWKVGDPINKLTKKGNYPSWSTVKSRYWKNVANEADEGEYSAQNLARMKKGKAPLHPKLNVPKELHHINGRNIPDPHNINNLQEVWPWEHADIDPFRHYKGPRP